MTTTDMASNNYSFTATFTLDKPHLTECYLESNSIELNMPTFLKSIILVLFGLVLLMFSDVNTYAAWFIVGLGVVEALSIYYHQPWWVLRQMMSRSYKSQVKVTIDEKGILSESHYNTGRLLWSDINTFTESEQGYVLFFDKSKNYLSKQILSQQAQDFIAQQLKAISS
ncbi:MAG: YcxB family protein [Colwellia sp.]